MSNVPHSPEFRKEPRRNPALSLPRPTQEELELGLPVRTAGIWTLDKFEVANGYASGFAVACSKRPRAFYYADPFCGPGVNLVQGQHYYGTPLIALNVNPPFTGCLLMDSSESNVKALTYRAQPFGDRADIRVGNCNTNFVPALREMVGPWDPCLCLLDPEGLDLRWSTVEAISRVPKRSYKVEQLILLPTTGFIRLLNKDGALPPWAPAQLTALFGNDSWRAIYDQRVARVITPKQAERRYVQLYGDGLRSLGYKTVLDRAICQGGHTGRVMYFLMFATDNDTGAKIMDSVFDRGLTPARPQPSQMSLFDEKPQRRRRLSG